MAEQLPLTLPLDVYAGITLHREYRWRPDGVTGQNFTGWTGRLFLGPQGGPALITETVGLDSTGLVVVEIAASVTAQLCSMLVFYQVDLTDPAGKVWRFLRGPVKVTADVSP